MSDVFARIDWEELRGALGRDTWCGAWKDRCVVWTMHPGRRRSDDLVAEREAVARLADNIGQVA